MILKEYNHLVICIKKLQSSIFWEKGNIYVEDLEVVTALYVEVNEFTN